MKDKKKIIQIVRSPAGGIRKHVISLIEGIDDISEVVLITDERMADSGYKEFKNRTNIKIYDLKINDKPGLLDIYNCLKVYLILHRERADIVHGHGAKGGIYSRVCGFLNGSKVFYTAHGGSMHLMHGLFKNILYSFIEKFLFVFTDKIIFESRYSMDTFARRVCDDSEKFILNYNGVSPRNTRKTILNLLQKDSVNLASFGLLRKIKGHHLVIDAVRVLKEKHGLNIRYTIFGEGEEIQNLRNQALRNNVDSCVEINNYTNDIDAEMLEADIVIHPSEFESFGYVPVESMILGVPTIGSLNGGLHEVFNEGKVGFVIDELSSDAIVKQVKYIVNNHKAVQLKCEEAKKFVEENFSEESFVAKYVNIILKNE